MKIIKLVTVVITLTISSQTNAALFERLNGLAYYDDVLDITWMANADALADEYGSGTATWSNVNAWVNDLSIGGITGWRLPTVLDTGPAGKDYTNGGTDTGNNVQTTDRSGRTVYSELASLYYDTLGNISFVDVDGNAQSGSGMLNTGPFSGFGASHPSYWSVSVTNPTSVSDSWLFVTSNGSQVDPYNYGSFAAIAVLDGDVSTVPVPAAVWLFGSGLIGLIGIARRKKV